MSSAEYTIQRHMDHRALYRKYRPQVFGEVIGQEHVTRTLVREAREKRVAHAYLFAGPRGTGKTSTARILAKAINCEDPRPDGEPCDRCATCGAITAGSSLDVQELDAASHNSVENIREIRVQVTMVAAGPSAHRVFILDEAHMLSVAACNALLKTLEEPPPNVHFILATTEPYKLLDTIRSRSQRFDFHPVSTEVLTAHLRWVAEQEGYEVAERGLETVARHAQGSVRDSLSLLEQVAALGDGTVSPEGVEQALGVANRATMNDLARAVADRDAPSVLSLVARLDRGGVNLRAFVSDAIGFFRGAYLAHHLPDPAAVFDEPAEVVEDWRETAGILEVPEINRVIDQLGDALIKIREGREERLMLEMALLWIVRPETSFHPVALLRRIEALESRIEGGAVADPGGAPSRPAPGRSGAGPPRPTAPAESASPAGPGKPAAEDPSPPPASAGGPAMATPPSVAGDAGTLTFERLRDLWPQLVGEFGGMDGALLRPTVPVAWEGRRLVVDCSDIFRRDRLEERNVPSRIGEEIQKLTGKRARVEFVVQHRDDLSVSTTEQPEGASAPAPDSPPEAEEPGEPSDDPGPEKDDDPPPEEGPRAEDEIPEPARAEETSEETTEPDITAFFEAGDISVTEEDPPHSGPSLF